MDAGATVRWLLAAVLALAALWIMSLNAVVFGRRFLSRNRARSWIPAIGGLLGAGAVLLVPESHVSKSSVPYDDRARAQASEGLKSKH